MVYMDIVRSPYAHAKILKIDASEALEIPGVLAVITGEDLKKAGNLHWMPTLMSRHADGAADREGASTTRRRSAW